MASCHWAGSLSQHAGGALSRAAVAQLLISTLHQLMQRRRARWRLAVLLLPSGLPGLAERQEDRACEARLGGLPQPRAVDGGSTREKCLQTA